VQGERAPENERKRAQARDLLAQICGWFTEGFDTPDPKETKAPDTPPSEPLL
jgi:hypothetical protein